MVVSLTYSLVPCPADHFPIQTYGSEKAAVCPDPGQGMIERHERFRQPPSLGAGGAVHFNIPGSRYDESRCLHYSDADQVGRLINIYA